MKQQLAAALVATTVMAGTLFALPGTEQAHANAAASAIQIEVLGKTATSDAAPIIDKGRVLVPLRAVSEAFGAHVEWNAKTNTAVVRKWGVTVRFTTFSNVAVVERNQPGGMSKLTQRIDAPMKLHGNRAYVPLRFLAVQFGYTSDWHDRTVFISSYIGKKKHDTLNQGTLAEARKVAVELSYSPQYVINPLNAENVGEADGATMLFAEGEAMRFIRIDGNLAQQMEIKDDQAVVTWAGRLAGPIEDQLRIFMKGKWTNSVGTAPKPSGDFIFYNSGIFGETGWTEYGVVNAEGAYKQTGYKHYGFGEVDTETGTLEIAKPGEKRTDTVGQTTN
ncbi:copper amine oxidase N-terminal domain-containing protein [Paenibacillus sp. CF384]|uniref:copper amine oxidase N-terminal domain-containing protein n=1 Tax=Paenibacillus sp. CF384 TaxID=1884382 RepID=UPI000896C117|nr:copper amine oxidase N-terminal domain-containing protein [Paenibacillus sp. CF384]SDX49073.1 Copper amine oxidase N-terminal domain-containing protein [Paenibacillus sp. CF384]